MRRLLAYEADRARWLYRRAEEGWGMLEPRSQACIRVAHRLYSEILDRVEAADWQVFAGRVAVPTRRKAIVALREVVRRPRSRPPAI